jgi:UBX domain-containing protein 11
MEFKRGEWKPGKAFNVGDITSLLDDKSAKRIAEDAKFAMPPKPRKENDGGHNPFVKASDYGKKGKLGHQKGGSRGNSQDRDLMSSMMSRLTALEKVNRSLKKEIQEKSVKIEALEKENEILTVACNSDYHKKYKEVQDDRDKYKKLTEDMKQFLSDYGLKWVGHDGPAEGEFDSDAVHKEISYKGPNYRNNLPPEIDTEILTRRIEELNFIAEKNKIVNSHGVNKFKKHDDFPIWFFKNGLILKGFPFYPYYSKEAQSVLSDILDGYFPYDLKKIYPDGVPLKPIDRINEVFNPNEVKKNPKYADIDNFSAPKAGISKKEFLDQFPKNVIKNGKIIPIREELEKKFRETKQLDLNKLNTNEPIEISTHVVEAEVQEEKKFDKADIVMLRIRTETGKRNLILKLLATDAMQLVYEYIKPYLEDETKKVEVRSNFPKKSYEEGDPTSLKDLGLYPTAALVIHRV